MGKDCNPPEQSGGELTPAEPPQEARSPTTRGAMLPQLKGPPSKPQSPETEELTGEIP